MELNKTHWAQKDVEPFKKFLLSFSKGEEKGKWEQRIANTKLSCIAVPSPKVKEIAKQIAKGNFLEFLNLNIWENLTCTFINGFLICEIKDFSLFEKYLKDYAEKCDNWASTDTLKFKITNKNKNEFFKLGQKLTKSKKTFVKRIGLIMFLKLLNYDEFTTDILNTVKSFYDEKEYYVNMVNAWIVCESFIKHRKETLTLLKEKSLNKFTQNKAISKCRDSFRISLEDKEMLKTLRI